MYSFIEFIKESRKPDNTVPAVEYRGVMHHGSTVDDKKSDEWGQHHNDVVNKVLKHYKVPEKHHERAVEKMKLHDYHPELKRTTRSGGYDDVYDKPYIRPENRHKDTRNPKNWQFTKFDKSWPKPRLKRWTGKVKQLD